MPFLGDQTLGDIPIPHNWEFADATARAVATDPITGIAYVSSDIGKWCKQLDTKNYYSLTAITPTWQLESPSGITGNVAITSAGVSTVTNLTIASEARGDILYRGATVWQRLAKGTATHVLTMGANDPAWSAPSGGGATTITFAIDGNLYVANDIIGARIRAGFTSTTMNVAVKTAPTGANLTGTIEYSTDETSWASIGTFTITDGSKTGTTAITQVFADDSFWRLNIATVGSTVVGNRLMGNIV
jgi:hypothetical protein